jgi:CubicO group peptidase (beta-lactamase class C family)
MISLRGLIAGLACGFYVTVSGLAQGETLLPQDVVKAAQDRITAGTYPALVFGVVDGEKSEVVAFGTLDNGKVPDGDTIFEIGSITKTFTATLLAKATLSGKVTPETPVAQLLPDFKIPSRNGKQISLADLATHYSALPRLPVNMMPGDWSNPYADYDADKLKSFLAEYELPRDPGASYEYSNLGFGILGYALEKAEHKSYAALVDGEVFKPLGMASTFTESVKAYGGNLAPGHDEVGDATANWDFDVLAGAGAIRSSAKDMMRYLKANMGVEISPLASAMKLAQQPRKAISASEQIGFAWMTNNKGIVWHSGGTGGYRSFLSFTADGRRGVIVMTNVAVEVDDLGFAALDPDAKLAPTVKASALPAASLDDYAGTYKLAESFLLQVYRLEDHLYAQATGQEPFPIFATAPNEFFARTSGISMTFKRDEKGKVNGLIFRQGGNYNAPKIEEPKTGPEVQLDAGILAGYLGEYRFEQGLQLTVSRLKNHLVAQLSEQPPAPIFASGKDRFFYKIVDAQLDFQRDASGKVAGVTLRQNGMNLPAVRVGS